MQSARIKQWIIANGLTQQLVADRIGYLRGSVTRALGREQVSSDFWARFSAAFPEAAAELLLASQCQQTTGAKAKDQ